MKKITVTFDIDVKSVPIKNTKHYLLSVIEYEEGTNHLNRQNIGFNTNELYGVISFAKEEIRSMIYPEGTEPKFDQVTRVVKNCKVTQIKKKDEISK